MSGLTFFVSTVATAVAYARVKSAKNHKSEGKLKNQAFVFIKPHANTLSVKSLVRSMLGNAGLTITGTGEISGTEIDEKKLIDQHYYAIASKATILDPTDIPVPNEKFEKFFGESYGKVLADSRAFNAMGACKHFGCTAAELEGKWRAAEAEGGKIVKLGGGFYVGKLGDIYVFNAFFMSMRAKYVGAEVSINYFTIEWEEGVLSWEDFRGKLLGPTDPAEGEKGKSIRRAILDDWKSLGLPEEPTRGDNGVHASASPLEGLAELTNWLSMPIDTVPFGKRLIQAGVTAKTISDWCKDARVKCEEGRVDSIFDEVEDKDAGQCLEMLIAINKL